jgi:CRP/FNR family transcriptional regulator, cyclic AMP receptor protein
MKTLKPIVAQHPFFADLEPQYLDLIAGCASNTRFDADQIIFREGGDANHFYLIRQGKVAINLYVPNRGALTVETIGEGDVLGWGWLFPPYRWHFDAQAMELTRAIAFDAACLRDNCEKDHDLGYALLKRFAQIMMDRLQATRLQLMDIYGVRT